MKILKVKSTTHEKKCTVAILWLLHYFFIGIMLSVFQQFVGISSQCCAFLANIFFAIWVHPPILLYYKQLLFGVLSLLFTVLAILTVDRIWPQSHL